MAVVLEAWIPAYENYRKAVDAEVAIVPKVEPKAVLRHSVAVIAATLLPVRCSLSHELARDWLKPLCTYPLCCGTPLGWTSP